MCFKNYSNRTNSSQKDSALKPILLRLNSKNSMEKVEEIIKNFPNNKIKIVEDYHEIFLSTNEIEYTISFIENDNKTNLTILGYSDKHPFKIKKNLKTFMLFLKDNLKEYIV